MCSVYLRERYYVMQKNKILSLAVEWLETENIMLSVISQT